MGVSKEKVTIRGKTVKKSTILSKDYVTKDNKHDKFIN